MSPVLSVLCSALAVAMLAPPLAGAADPLAVKVRPAALAVQRKSREQGVSPAGRAFFLLMTSARRQLAAAGGL